ncbi:urease accessory protein UreF [Nonomuraea cavernae]|uniref:urease accessory protein UreF n=1 Tax=Nonomuraea cavernae TaxID=2045107 RepID=UPI0033C2E0FB
MSLSRGGLEPLFAQFQLTDSGFPSGLYTLSHGLEGYVQEGLIGSGEPSARRPTDPLTDPLTDLLTDLLENSVGPGDATALVLAHRAVKSGDWDRVVEVDRRLHAIKLAREPRTASTRTGKQVLATAVSALGSATAARLADLVACEVTPGNHAVVIGVVHAGGGVPVTNAVAGDLHAFAASFTAAAVRLGRTDFRRAQAILREVRPVLARVARAALDADDPRDVHGCVPVADTVSAAHERAPARLFIT